MSSEAQSRVTVPWLSPETKQKLAGRIAPLTRHFLRLIPSNAMREAFWETVIVPRLWWRTFDFVVQTSFGAKVADNTSDVIPRYLCYFGVWEPNLTAWISTRLKPGDVFVDIGANIGYFSLLASHLVGESGRAVAIEPAESTFALLKRNLELSHARNTRTVNVAVSDHEEELELFLPESRDSARATLVYQWAQHVNFRRGPRVRTLPLERILDGDEVAHARLIKIDVEGYENRVLASLLPLLPKCRPDMEIVVEVTPSALADQGTTPSDVLGGFIASGFNIYEIDNEYSTAAYLRSWRPRRPYQLTDCEFSCQKDLILSRETADNI